MTEQDFDVIIVGGGIAGSTLGGVLARGGLGVLVVEREVRFRDRIRGEVTWPWGVAEARRAGLDELLDAAGTALCAPSSAMRMESRLKLNGSDGPPATSLAWGFVHPRVQEAAFAWAADRARRYPPGQGDQVSHNARPSLKFAVDGSETELTAPLDRGRRWQAVDGAALGGRRERRGPREPPHGWSPHLGRRLRAGVGQRRLDRL